MDVRWREAVINVFGSIDIARSTSLLEIRKGIHRR
jgi:hypothetical protein